MLRIVTSNNAEIFRHLDAKALQSAGVEHSIATDYHSTLELIRTKRPDIAIVDIDLVGGDGYALCHHVKSDPQLESVRVILVHASVLTRKEIERLNKCGVDDVLAVPLPSDEFFRHIIQIADLPHRKNDRVDVSVDVSLEVDGTVFAAEVDNLSLGGLGIRITAELAPGQVVDVSFFHNGKTYPPVRTTVAWTRKEGETSLAGLTFAEIPIETRLLIEDLCLFDAAEAPDGGVTVRLHGDIVESTDFGGLAKRLDHEDRIEFNMREVRYLSSTGVRKWCQFVMGLRGKTYSFWHASMAFATQASMVPMVAGDGEILSFDAPYHCESCDRDDVRLLEAKSVMRERDEFVPPTLHCATCKGELLFDDMPWRYFAFLNHAEDGP